MPDETNLACLVEALLRGFCTAQVASFADWDIRTQALKPMRAYHSHALGKAACVQAGGGCEHAERGRVRVEWRSAASARARERDARGWAHTRDQPDLPPCPSSQVKLPTEAAKHRLALEPAA
eukprot:6206932-Pleurochrysis_carterae.AAC.1